MPRARIPGEERVFSLVLALIASPQGLTKHDLLSSVYGYSDRYRAGGRAASIERQFERDKEQLRTLGIPLESFDSPHAPGDNRLIRYRISKERLELPASLRFTAEELQTLNLAALAWSDGSLGDESRWARMKVTSLSANLDPQHLGIAPRISIPEPGAPALQRAIDEGLTVRFDYQLPGRDAPLGRIVAPLRLHRAEGRWHLIAYDLEREAGRVFLLSRVTSEIQMTTDRFDPQLRELVTESVASLLALAEHQVASVRVRRGSIAESRLSSRARSISPGGAPAYQDLEVGTLDWQAFAREMAGYGADVTVLHPESLRETVTRLLRTVRAGHA